MSNGKAPDTTGLIVQILNEIKVTLQRIDEFAPVDYVSLYKKNPASCYEQLRREQPMGSTFLSHFQTLLEDEKEPTLRLAEKRLKKNNGEQHRKSLTAQCARVIDLVLEGDGQLNQIPDALGKAGIQDLVSLARQLSSNPTSVRRAIDENLHLSLWKGSFQYTSGEMGLIHRNFSLQYNDSNSQVAKFLTYVDWACENWIKAVIYAPYIAVLQSSGFGKSRLVAACSKHVQVFHICMRSKESSGYPLRTPRVAAYVTEENLKAEVVRRRFRGVICALLRAFHRQTSRDEAFYRGQVEGQTSFYDTLDLAPQSGEDLTDVLAAFVTEKLPVYGRGLRALLFWDEVSILTRYTTTDNLSYYHCLRQVLRDFADFDANSPGNHGLLAVFADTIAQLDGLSEPSTKDSSLRVVQGLRLWPPYTAIESVDVGFTPEDSNPRTLGEVCSDRRLLKYGRPLISSWILGGGEITALLNTLKAKLLGGLNFEKWAAMGSPDAVTALAVLGPRVCVDVAPQSTLSATLVASHMRVCLGVSLEKDTIYTSYISEPALAEASASITRDPRTGIDSLLPPVIDVVRQGAVEGGFRGELTARILLTLAWDSVTSKSARSSTPIAVRQFLTTLGGETAVNCTVGQTPEATRATMLDAFIMFTHFVRVSYVPSRVHLLSFLKRGAAILCKRGQKGIDLIIPALLGNGTIAPGSISAIVVQIRNYQSLKNTDRKYKTAAVKVHPVYAGIEGWDDMPFLSLYLQLGRMPTSASSPVLAMEVPAPPMKRLRSSNVPIDTRRQLGVVFFGLDPGTYPFLPDSTARLLSDLLKTEVDIAMVNQQVMAQEMGSQAMDIKEARHRLSHLEPLVYHLT